MVDTPCQKLERQGNRAEKTTQNIHRAKRGAMIILGEGGGREEPTRREEKYRARRMCSSQITKKKNQIRTKKRSKKNERRTGQVGDRRPSVRTARRSSSASEEAVFLMYLGLSSVQARRSRGNKILAMGKRTYRSIYIGFSYKTKCASFDKPQEKSLHFLIAHFNV